MVILPPGAGVLAAALLGLVIGSFLNVLIARLPEGRNVVIPPSLCPHCSNPIPWRDNLPLLSFILLGGRCRRCRTPISRRYPAVEILTAALFMLAYGRRGWSADLPAALLLIAMLIVIAGIDLDHQIIPHVLTLPGIAVGVLANLATGHVPWVDALLGILLGGGIFFVTILASRGGMGGGDMNLGAMLGAFLGWKLGLLAVLLAVFAGGLVAMGLLALGRKGRKDPVPFGPFLALGGTVSLLWGDRLLDWYLGTFIG